jgi:hypothetical protein
MNERIRELLLEAREQTAEGKWRAPADVWAQKFAELIVRECVAALDTMPRYYKQEDAKRIERDTIYDCVRTIKEHFGVE